MKDLLRMLRVPLTLEGANVLLHRVAHWTNFGSTYVDTASVLVSVAIVVYAAWLVSRQTRRVLPAVLAGLIVWAFSVALAVLLMTMEVFVGTSLRDAEGPTAIAGFVFSSMLVLPLVIAITSIAALVARRSAP